MLVIQNYTMNITINRNTNLLFYPILSTLCLILFYTAHGSNPADGRSSTNACECQNHTHQSSEDTVNKQTNEIGEEVQWYDGERAPKSYTGYLSTQPEGYVFNIGPKPFLVVFYDEDAEYEAIEIAKKYSDMAQNITLVGYQEGEDRIEVIYGKPINKELISTE
jgi:hypothetical protein